MRIIYNNLEVLHTSPERFLSACREIGEGIYRDRLAMDMDGVQEWDDVAHLYTDLLDPENGKRVFGAASRANLRAVENGMACYCWFAIGVLPRYTLDGVEPEVMRAIGRHIRLVPGAKEFVELIGEDVSVHTFTAGYSEAAKEVAARLSIPQVTATELEKSGNKYTGRLERFIGGTKKAEAIRNQCPDGMVLDDSWSGVNAMGEFPSIAFNPKYPPTVQAASVNVYAPSLLGLVPFLVPSGKWDRYLKPEHLPRLVVVNWKGKPGKLVSEECRMGSEMRKTIAEEVERMLQKDKMIEMINRDLADCGVRFPKRDLSRIDMQELTETALQEYERMFGCQTL